VREVPCENVAAGVTQDVEIGEEGWCQVNPSLIGEEPGRDVRAEKMLQPSAPPPSEAQSLVGGLNAEETEAVNTMFERADPVVDDRFDYFLGFGLMRGQR
jgi:hypothetical protein